MHLHILPVLSSPILLVEFFEYSHSLSFGKFVILSSLLFSYSFILALQSFWRRFVSLVHGTTCLSRSEFHAFSFRFCSHKQYSGKSWKRFVPICFDRVIALSFIGFSNSVTLVHYFWPSFPAPSYLFPFSVDLSFLDPSHKSVPFKGIYLPLCVFVYSYWDLQHFFVCLGFFYGLHFHLSSVSEFCFAVISPISLKRLLLLFRSCLSSSIEHQASLFHLRNSLKVKDKLITIYYVTLSFSNASINLGVTGALLEAACIKLLQDLITTSDP